MLAAVVAGRLVWHDRVRAVHAAARVMAAAADGEIIVSGPTSVSAGNAAFPAALRHLADARTQGRAHIGSAALHDSNCGSPCIACLTRWRAAE